MASILAANSNGSIYNSMIDAQLTDTGTELDFDIDEFGNYIEISNDSLYTLNFFLPLYSKLNTSDILGNHARENILTLITAQPGITLGAITRTLNLKNGTALHHLRILEREDYIKSKKAGKFRRYYKLGVKASEFNEVQDKILQKIGAQPGITQSDIARGLGLSRQLINYHLKYLVSSNVVMSERIGNKSFCYFY